MSSSQRFESSHTFPFLETYAPALPPMSWTYCKPHVERDHLLTQCISRCYSNQPVCGFNISPTPMRSCAHKTTVSVQFAFRFSSGSACCCSKAFSHHFHANELCELLCAVDDHHFPTRWKNVCNSKCHLSISPVLGHTPSEQFWLKITDSSAAGRISMFAEMTPGSNHTLLFSRKGMYSIWDV